jgi:hypothetical protein
MGDHGKNEPCYGLAAYFGVTDTNLHFSARRGQRSLLNNPAIKLIN